jgi:polysaccharide biosynthesis/export protein
VARLSFVDETEMTGETPFILLICGKRNDMSAQLLCGATPMKRAFKVICLVFVLVFVGSNLRAEEAAYKLAPKDTLEISVWKDEALSKQLVVPPDGVVSFPLAGDITAKGLTVPELREVIKKKLSEFIPEPTVTVMLLSPASLTAYVIGKVNKPGEFPIVLDTNVLQILSTAGGFNPFAAPNKIVILRQSGEKLTRIPFDYNKVEKGESPEQNILLQRGDVVLVP